MPVPRLAGAIRQRLHCWRQVRWWPHAVAAVEDGIRRVRIGKRFADPVASAGPCALPRAAPSATPHPMSPFNPGEASLTDPQRAAWHALGIFSAPFDPFAALEIAGADPDTLDVL